MSKQNKNTAMAIEKKPMSPEMKKKLRLLLWIGAPALLVLGIVLAVILSLSQPSPGYNLFLEDMGNYFTLTREDYTGNSFTIDKKYEVTDEMVESYIEGVLLDHRTTTISLPVALGDTVGLYIRAVDHEGKPLSGYAVPTHFTALSSVGDDGERFYSYNYFMSDPAEIKLGEDDGLPTSVRDAVLGTIPKDTVRQTSVGGKVNGTETVFLTYISYYTDDKGNAVFVDEMSGLLVDLSAPSDNLLYKKTVGQTVGRSYSLKNFEKRVIDGVERELTYDCLVERVLDKETALTVSETLSADAFSAESPYAYLNGQTITYHIVIAGCYTTPVLSESFIRYKLNFKTDDKDVVGAYRRAVKEALIQEQKNENIYAVLWGIASAEWEPSSYPAGVVAEVMSSVEYILADQDFNTNYEAAGFQSAEEYIRNTFGLTGDDYKELSLREALSQYIYAVKAGEMLYYFFIQKEDIGFTEEEYMVYLERRTAELQQEFGDPRISLQYTEEYYDRQYGTGYLGTGFLRECLMYEKIAEFLYQNNTIEYKEMENAE